MKFKIKEIIITDDEGFLALKGLLPEGSILWSRAVDGKVAVCLSPEVDLHYIEKNFNSIYRTLRIY
tara:strand:+ start:67 stop:264 length:198 start_codon:yes stop_codon:yes gene_type:complete